MLENTSPIKKCLKRFTPREQLLTLSLNNFAVNLFGKYVFRETFIVCCTATGLFVGILLVANAMRDVVEWIMMRRLMCREAFQLLGILVPSVISYALPLGMMAGILVVVGRMSSQNEILAMKSIGMSLWEITRPMFFLALSLTLFAGYINLYYAPDSVSRYRQFFKDIVREKPMRFITPKIFNDYFPGYAIYVDDLSNGNFSGMKIWKFDERNLLDSYISAKSGQIIFEELSGTFLLKLNDGNIEKFDIHDSATDIQRVPKIIFFQNITINLPAKEFLEAPIHVSKKFHRMTLSELLAAKKSLNFKKDTISYESVRHQKTLINMQISINLANAFGMLAMTIVAIPLGMKVHRRDTALNIGMAICLCIGYYFVMAMFSLFGDYPRLRPDILVWLPNVTLVGLGLPLFHRVSQH
ncbi:MAG: LptF/LptG family permease [Puniceicoccales bacterium]|jgi:lipopolysaccharide export system permease protein|nr:LptF/LptG family permease [Puniceicoccales bacterium]